MLLTEEEARKKWCPRCTGEASANCVASRCMAWREVPIDDLVRAEINKGDRRPMGVIAADIERRGYCGLAGKVGE